MKPRLPENLLSLREILPIAERGLYAVGSFSPRYTAMIRPVLLTAERLRSPAIIQISSNELRWYRLSAGAFAAEFYKVLHDERISVPVVLHLDHTKDTGTIVEAMDAGFTSVMIDASESVLDENMHRTRAVVEIAHPRRVSVEGELGRIGTTDFMETDRDEEMYTDPDEASLFVRGTGVDALAVSVGTAHGVYTTRRPRIDCARLRAIRERTRVHLVLHGGSGVPAEMMAGAIRLPGGGISKVNIATDLEQAALAALNRAARMTDEQMNQLAGKLRGEAEAAVARTVAEKIEHFVSSAGRADDPVWETLTSQPEDAA